MVLETRRLKIIPLTIEQFRFLLEGMEVLEKELGLNSSNEPMGGHTLEAMEELYHLALEHEKQYPFYSNWQIIEKTKNISIGSACFMGTPNKKGQVEIGYGMNMAYRCKGYMTEAVEAMANWALSQNNVIEITANTDIDNLSSQKVLQKCDFQKIGKAEDGYFFVKTKK